MGFPCTVDVLENCRISPPNGSVSMTSLPLTFFDIIWLSLPPVERLFFYELNHSKTHFLNTILPNIKHSLSFILQHFFPLAGNLTWPQESTKPEILYMDGDSVSLTVAETDYDFYQLSGNHARDANNFSPLVPELLNMSNNQHFPVLALQVTLFPNKGICIGVTYNHTVADGGMLIQFVKSWASVCQSQGDASLMTTETLLFFDRSMVQDPNGIDVVLLNHFKKYNITKETFNVSKNGVIPIDKVRATFVLGRSDIKRIKQWVLTHLKNEKNNSQPMRLSTFVLTCAYVWVCLIKARRGEAVANANEDPNEYFGFPVDCRARLVPPLPVTYFGNCLRGCVLKAKASDLIGENGIAIAAELITTAIQEIDDGAGILKDLERMVSYDLSSIPDQLLSVAGSTKMGVYDPDFGWGIPKKAEVASIASTGAMSLSECPNEIGAVEVGLVRNKMQMEAFSTFFVKTLEDFPQRMGAC